MSAWIGPPGGLVEILHYKGGLSVSQERAQSTRTTLGGRVKVQRGPRVRREWSASTPHADPNEAASFLALIQAGTPPWAWVDPYAQVTNMFTPEQSTLVPGSWAGSGWSQGGAVLVDGLQAPSSVSHPSGATVDFGFRNGSSDRPAVIPGLPVSASAVLRGSGGFGIQWVDWSGATIGSATTSYNNPSLARVSVENRVPPAGAARARLFASGALQAAMPCLSWTPEASKWSMGRGCTRAVVEGLSEDIQEASSWDVARRRSALSFTVREVG